MKRNDTGSDSNEKIFIILQKKRRSGFSQMVFILALILTVTCRVPLVAEKEQEQINEARNAGVETGIFSGVEMVLVPAGNFSRFWISRCEVTQKLYKSVMGTNPSYFRGDNLPVEQVSWYNAVEFCNKLSLIGGYKPFYIIDKDREDPDNKNLRIKWTVSENRQADGFRLPASAEWEYAARAGSKARYFWGDTINGDYCWYNDNSLKSTHPVGLKKSNAWGIYDICGNVREWCFEWHPDFYGLCRIVRDGHYCLEAEDLLPEIIDCQAPQYEFGFIGIRLVKGLSSKF